MSSYKLLRETTDLTDDTDHVLVQTDPGGLADLRRGFARAAESGDPIHIECMLEWIDGAGDPVITSRGSFDATIMRQMDRPASIGGGVFVDAVALVGVPAYRPFLVDDIMPGDDFTVLLSSMVAPVGATRARVLYREFI